MAYFGDVPQGSCFPVVPLSVVVGTDVSVVLVSYTGLAQVLGVVASRVVLDVLHARHAAVTKEVADGWCKNKTKKERVRRMNRRCRRKVNSFLI